MRYTALSIGLLLMTVGAKSQEPKLPEPYATKSSTNLSKIIGWPQGKTPQAPTGFIVTKYAENFKSPRNMYVAPNGDIFIAEANKEVKGILKVGAELSPKLSTQQIDKSANRITVLKDLNKDGIPEVRETFLEGLNQPFGMLILGNYFYVANADAVWRYPYKTGQTTITATGEKLIDLQVGHHWTRNIVANADASKIYISIGSASNIAEHGIEKETNRACIIEMNPDGSGSHIYAHGLRNPVGMDWAPGTHTLWTAVNERDELGDDLVPDYLTSVREGGFYGWPYSYFGQHIDPRIKEKEQRPDLVKKAIIPDVSLGSHTAALGLAFYDKKSFPAKYHNGAFVGLHGSWNRSTFSGYKVVFVPFKNGKPSGSPEDFLVGFIASDDEVYGRPVGVAVLPDGSLLVSDDGTNTIWRVSKK
jgi:glucose/arabinose dehydrogenase